MTVLSIFRRIAIPVLATAISCITLTGCYETQLSILSVDNAHPSPVVENGRYCEVVFKPAISQGQITHAQLAPEHNIERCFTLTWVAQARGWRTDIDGLGKDELGISLRARKLGYGSDSVGRSSFFMIQAGAPPRQITVAGRSMTVSTAQLLNVFAQKDMFVVIRRSLPANDVVTRAKHNNVALVHASNGLTIPYLSQLGQNPADTIGRWLAREAAYEILGAQISGPQTSGIASEKNTLSFFTRVDDAKPSPEALRDRLHQLLRSMLSETNTINADLALGLAPARMDLNMLN